MTAQVELDLRAADEEVARKTEKANEAKHLALASVAAEVPDRVDAIAKDYAHQSPEVAQALGKDGIAQLRAELTAEAENLSLSIRSSIEDVRWPEPTPGSSRVSAIGITTALAASLSTKVEPLCQIFKERRFPYSRTKIAAGLLSNNATFHDVSEAIKDLGEANERRAAAKAAYDKETVESLWGE